METTKRKETWKNKTLSRTWRLTVFWLVLTSVMLVAQVVMTALGSRISLPLGEVIALSGAVTTAYIGKRAVQLNRDAHAE